MIKKSIEEFKSKYPQFELEQFIEAYLEGDSREVLSNRFNVGEMPLRMLAKSLGLDWVKSKRHTSILEFRYNLGLEDNILDVNLVKELEAENRNLVKENTKLYQSLTLVRDSNNVLRKHSRQEARESNLVEHMLDSFEKHLNSLEVINKPFIMNKYNYDTAILKDGLVLVLGDAHVGDTAKKEECGNNYNFEVIGRRLDYMFEKTINNPLQSRNLLVVELLDILRGLLHNSEYLSEGGITGAMLKVVELYSEIYVKLASYYENIDVVVTNSNHDRTTQWVTSHMKWDNFGIMLYKMIEMLLKAKGIDNVNFKYTMQEHHLININTADVFVTHADAIRSYKAYSQAERAKVQAICLGMFGKPYKHMICGHLHQSIAASNEYGGYNIVNGTLMGNSSYGVSNGFATIQPVQTIMFIDFKGDIEQLSFINLGHIQ